MYDESYWLHKKKYVVIEILRDAVAIIFHNDSRLFHFNSSAYYGEFGIFVAPVFLPACQSVCPLPVAVKSIYCAQVSK